MTDMPAEAFQDAAEEESGIYDTKGNVSFDEAKEDASVQVIADVLDLMINAKLQARQKPVNTAVNLVTAISCADVKKELLKSTDEDSVHAKVCPEMKVEDWPLVSSNLDFAGVLTRRAHPQRSDLLIW